jgi:dTDP-glucose 4,6-dehydratase
MNHPLAEDLGHVLVHTQGLWEDLRGKRIFLTGGTGFFGTWLLESFLWANRELGLGAEIVVLTRDPAAFHARAPRLCADPALTPWVGNQVDFTFPDGPFEAVVHAAVEYGAPLETFERNLLGMKRVLDFTRVSGARRFLLTSSGAVYGPQPVGLEALPEDHPGSPDLADPRSAYGLAKRASEHLGHLHAQAHGFSFTVARGFAFLGPHLPLNQGSAIGNFIGDALAGGPILINGDGTPLRSYLYAADLAVWLWTILLRGGPGRVYNVGGDRAHSIADAAARVREVLASGAEVRIAQRPEPGRAPSRYLPEVSRARAELGLEVWIPLDEAIRRTGRWAALPIQDRIGR